MTLTETIAADLRRRLAEKDPALDLRLASLASNYQVSTQPVRLALAQLAREGIVRREGTRSFGPGRAPRRRQKQKSAGASPAALTIADVHRELSKTIVRL